MDMFNSKYEEFAKDLEATCPELSAKIATAVALPVNVRKSEFKTQVLPSCAPSRDSAIAPAFVLPGVDMPTDVWASLSANSKKAIQEYLTLLSFSFLVESGTSGDLSGTSWTADWATGMMDEMKEKMKNIDFAGLSEKIAGLFGSAANAAGAAGAAGGEGGNPFGPGFPQLPEKFLKGKLAKLAEDIVKEFKPEDFGLRPEDLAEVERDPTRAFEILMKASAVKPEMLQKAMTRVSKKLQDKIQKGQLRPEELAAEAEELMKEFQSHPAFAEMMRSFKSAFSFEDPDAARASGRDNQARLSIVQKRLRAKLAARNAAKEAAEKK
jgi:hypothetical protein